MHVIPCPTINTFVLLLDFILRCSSLHSSYYSFWLVALGLLHIKRFLLNSNLICILINMATMFARTHRRKSPAVWAILLCYENFSRGLVWKPLALWMLRLDVQWAYLVAVLQMFDEQHQTHTNGLVHRWHGPYVVILHRLKKTRATDIVRKAFNAWLMDLVVLWLTPFFPRLERFIVIRMRIGQRSKW
jgi:hypothetical protein